MAQVADLAGASRQTAANWIKRHPDTFPAPAIVLGDVRGWDRADVLAWLRDTGRMREVCEPTGETARCAVCGVWLARYLCTYGGGEPYAQWWPIAGDDRGKPGACDHEVT